MLGRWLDRSHCPIGLEVGLRTLRAVQLRRRGAGYSLWAAAQAALPADAPLDGEPYLQAVRQTLPHLLQQAPFHGRQVVSCLSPRDITYKSLRLPRMPEEELTAAVEWEATDRLQLARDQTMVRFFNAGEVRQGEEVRQEVILMAAPLAVINSHVQMLTQCDLTPLAIDALPAALARALVAAQDQEQARFILYVGHLTSSALVVRDGRVMFFKLIDIGEGKFDQVVAQKLGISLSEARDLRRSNRDVPGPGGEAGDPAAPAQGAGAGMQLGAGRRQTIDRAFYDAVRPLLEELATEVGLCLRYYSVTFRGQRPEQLILSGVETVDAHLARVLEEGLHLRVQGVDPLAGVDLSGAQSSGAQTAPSPVAISALARGPWSVALGLAKYPVSGVRTLRRGAA